ncbi:uncharacterized protein LOC144873497 isoform X2 [Branchiostoma floridae x Branchiostoma japonicum]
MAQEEGIRRRLTANFRVDPCGEVSIQQLCHVLSDFRLTVNQVGKHVRKCFPDAAFKSGRGTRESRYLGISCSPAFPAFQPYVQPSTFSVPQNPWLVGVLPSQCQPTHLHSSQPAGFSHSSMQPAHLHSSQHFARCKCRMEGGDAMLKSVDIVPPKRARLSDHISEGDRNPPTTGVVGFSMETTLALLPRMHMEELQSELNRRNIVVKLAGEHQRGRGDLEHVLREVMTREYEVEEGEGMDTNTGNTSSTFEHAASNTSSAFQLMIRDDEAEEGKGMDTSNNSSAFEHCNSDTSSAFEHGSWLKEVGPSRQALSRPNNDQASSQNLPDLSESELTEKDKMCSRQAADISKTPDTHTYPGQVQVKKEPITLDFDRYMNNVGHVTEPSTIQQPGVGDKSQPNAASSQPNSATSQKWMVKIKTEPGLEEETEDEQLQDLRSELCPSSPGQLSQELDKVDVSFKEGGDEPSSKEPLKRHWRGLRLKMTSPLTLFLALTLMAGAVYPAKSLSSQEKQLNDENGLSDIEEAESLLETLEAKSLSSQEKELNDENGLSDMEEAESLLEKLEDLVEEEVMTDYNGGENDMTLQGKRQSDPVFKGCYVDTNPRKFPNAAEFGNSQQSTASCVSRCKSKGFAYAGTQYSNECFCGTEQNFLNIGQPRPNSECNKACSGNPREKCGGTWRMSVYKIPAESVYKGCYVDTNPRKFPNAAEFGNNQQSTASCVSRCKSKGFAYAGTQYSNECFCGTEQNFLNIGQPRPNSECNKACSGNPREKCGGTWRMSVYKIPAESVYKGCYVDTNPRKFPNAAEFGNNQQSTASCVSRCKSKGFAYAGTQYSNECFCGTEQNFLNIGQPRPNSECNKACSGNPREKCGGTWRMSVYKIPAESVYKGCYVDTRTRKFPNAAEFDNNQQSTARCVSRCKSKGFAYAGTQYSDECFCGTEQNFLNIGQPRPNSECNKACSGNPREKCGGTWRMSVFKI